MKQYLRFTLCGFRIGCAIAAMSLAGCISTDPLHSNWPKDNSSAAEEKEVHEAPIHTSVVRPATLGDLDAIEVMCQRKFAQYEKYQPLFYRVAADSREKHLAYLSDQINAGQQIMLVHAADGKVDGFIMAKVMVPTPVYEQKLVTCLVDDFVVDQPTLWDSVGAALLEETERVAHSRGTVQTVAVCGHGDEAKRRFLASRGMSITAEWYTKPQAPAATQPG